MSTKNKPSMAVENKYAAVKSDSETEGIRDPDMECGIGPCHPKALRCLSNIMTFSLVYSFSGLFSSTVSVYISSQITTLEKYFGFNSAQTGFLLSCNDIGYLLTTLFISYYARRVHIPRVLSITTVLFGISGIFCALAYFLRPNLDTMSPKGLNLNSTSDYSFLNQEAQMCDLMSDQNISKYDRACLDLKNGQFKTGIPTEFTPIAMAIIGIGMIIQGFGKSPRQPFVTTYIDDNVKKTKTALYMGIIMAIAVFGPALAFATGGIFSRIYVTLEDVDISPTHPQWIGAWWIGFIFFGGLALIAAIPLIFFPRRLHPKTKTTHDEVKKTDNAKAMKEWFKTMMRLLTNRLYMLAILNSSMALFMVGGYIAFVPKYLETQFSLPTWKANMFMGALTVVAACLGGFIGGAITSKLKLTPFACVKFMLGVNIFSFFTSILGFFLGCPNPEIVGYNTFSYSNNSASCLDGCYCDNTDYFPVCGSDGRTYFSPCHAGCSDQANQTYINCTCIFVSGTAVPGLCDTECTMLYPYILVTLVVGFIATLTAVPGLIFSLRSVPDKDKSMAVGLSSFLQTLLGWFPAPVVMGEIIDTTCDLWRSSCSKVGACAIYDNDSFRIKRHAVETGLKFAQVIVIFLAYWFSRNKNDWSTETSYDVNRNANKSLLDQEIIIPKAEYFADEYPIYKKQNGDMNGRTEMKTFKPGK